MKTILDPHGVLSAGLQAVRQQFKVSAAFAPAVLAAADTAAARPLTDHVDRTDWNFVTLDPASSTDLDQAFSIESAGGDLILHYAIADVGWFVAAGDPLDTEAWVRGTTMYLPDGKASLYPTSLSEGAASLLPDGPRPAVVFHVRIDGEGNATLDGATRSIIRNRAKLAYETVTAADVPTGFDELSRRISAAEVRRGASLLEPPQQGLSKHGDGYSLDFEPRLPAEDANAAMSLSTNLAVAAALQAAHTGLFRVMPEADDRAVSRLRHTAAAFGIAWPAAQTLHQFEATLSGTDPKQAAMMMAVRRAGGGASYVAYQAGVTPWHAAMAATYCHATAPLRRLADRYVVESTLATANGDPVPDHIAEALPKLGDVMAKADATGNQIDRAVIDLAESVIMESHIGETFDAVVTDDDQRGARFQLTELPVVARVAAHGVQPGDKLRVKVTAVDTAQRAVQFTRVG